MPTPARARRLRAPKLDDATDLFRALADGNRLVLLGRLCSAGRPLTVTEAATCCGVHLSGVSRHLAQMQRAGILIASKSGREVRYTVDIPHLVGALRRLADTLERCAPCCATTERCAANEGEPR